MKVLESFGYDKLNRLASASEANNGGTGTTPWSQTYGYDAYGNRWVSANSGVPLNSFTPTVSTNFDSSNHLLSGSATYDASGDQKTIGGFSNTFDAESRLTSSTLNSITSTYAYDGGGRRVQKTTGSAATNFVYDAQGQLAAEDSTQLAPVHGTEYLTADHLGSTRMTTDASGTPLALHDYVPFGDEIRAGVDSRGSLYGAADGVNKKFTGQYSDAETANAAMPSGLDYFGARYFSAAQGRFTSPDPLDIFALKREQFARFPTLSLGRSTKYARTASARTRSRCTRVAGCAPVGKEQSPPPPESGSIPIH